MSDLLARVQAVTGDAYHVQREITGGGMSRLFLANERSLNRRVVIKLLPPELTSEVSAARFQQEMELAASLQHPHILPVLAAGARDGLIYYIMPYVEGESLRGRITRDGALPVPDAVRLLAEIADALAFAHARGIIHRDIKPENILLEGKHAVLADFGIARALVQARTGDRLTGTGTSVGTPGYMAPEQVAGGAVDGRADLYSLAVVGYEILSGAPPFTGPSAQAVLAAHLTTPPLPLHELRAAVPESVSAIIAKALSKNPDDRFGTAVEFAESLSGAARTPADADHRRAVRPELRRLGRRTALVVIAIVVVVVAVQMVRVRARTRALVDHLALVIDSRELDASAKLDSVAAIIAQSGVSLKGSGMARIRDRVAGVLVVVTDPPGAVASLVRASPIATFAEHQVTVLGTTPARATAVIGGKYLLRLVGPEGDTVTRIVTVPAGDSVLANSLVPMGDSVVVQAMLRPADAPRGFVLVPAGLSPDSTVVAAFLMSRYEVTNADFSRFIQRGGYRDAALWPEQMLLEERPVSRNVAIARFVDRTGLPGPRDWSSGTPPQGREMHPVTGVSWYEADAYARWTGGRLPARSEWYRAALGDGSTPWPWGPEGFGVEQRANFGLRGTDAAGSHPLGVSPFGAEDMAGNVREWLADPAGKLPRRLAVGGSWRDPSYMFFARARTEGVLPDFAGDNIGIRVVRNISTNTDPSGRE